MKGMEGESDADGNDEITARELHTFVRENVVQQSCGSQVPELQEEGVGEGPVESGLPTTAWGWLISMNLV